MTQLQNDQKTKKIARLGLILALAIIFSYVEYLLPLPIGIPGIKLGLANSLVLLLLYQFNAKTAISVSVLRVIVMGLIFGNLVMTVYSFCGAASSILVMWMVKKWDCFSMTGISVLGAVTHNTAQLLVAMLFFKVPLLGYYFPILCIAGCVSGILTAVVGKELQKRISYK